MPYIEKQASAYDAFGAQIEPVLQTVADRLVGAHPRVPFTFRLSSAEGFLRNDAYRYVFDCARRFPEAKREQSVYAWAKLWSDGQAALSLRAVPRGPMEVFVNERSVYRSSYYEEKVQAAQNPIQIVLKAGWNSFVVRLTKTPFGFGGELGTYKYAPIHFLLPDPRLDGAEGFLYTGPVDELELLPRLADGLPENIRWYPETQWDEAQKGQGQLRRIYGLHPGQYAYGWSKVEPALPGGHYRVSGSARCPLTIIAQGEPVAQVEKAGTFEASFTTGQPFSDLVVEARCGETDWGYELTLACDDCAVSLANPCHAKGTGDAWLYVGPFAGRQEAGQLTALDRVFRTDDGDDYWRVDLPRMYVRPFLENREFGQWNYPVGVTLYGVAQAALRLHRPDLLEYVHAHIELCTRFYGYALWDRQTFGAAGIDAQITSVESLDDCGSFAFTMLDCAQRGPLEGFRPIADTVAAYISEKQARLPDGALYRQVSSLPDMADTLWLDDLYMSVPFLSRYYLLTGDARYADDAAKQFLLYREKTTIPENGLLSHVYYPKQKLATGVPWGRGNGWVLFSLTELLGVLPETHPLRPELLSFFQALCDAYAAVQDDAGLWHQVLDDPDSYPETSCSAMFICAFARGVRNGWVADRRRFADAACKGWRALTQTAVDRGGNLYGICRGSGHSFTPRYYKYDLGWILNDAHGIGVVLLAGCETSRMLESLSGPQRRDTLPEPAHRAAAPQP